MVIITCKTKIKAFYSKYFTIKYFLSILFLYLYCSFNLYLV